MYQVLVALIEEHSADIACCLNSRFDQREGDGSIECFDRAGIMEEQLKDKKGTGHSPCDKLYKRSLFDGLRFPVIRAYEDCATIYRVYDRTDKVVKTNLVLYHYVQRENSMMKQPFSAVTFLSIEAYRGMYDYYAAHYSALTPIVKRKLYGSIQHCVGETLVRKKKKELSSEMENARRIIKKYGFGQLSFKQKFLAFLICYWPGLYGFLYARRK